MTTRQEMGCVYEERIPAPRLPFVLRWPGAEPMALPFTPTACPLWLARYPALDEVNAARPHWERGELAAYVAGGDQAGELPSWFMDAVASLSRSWDELNQAKRDRRRGGA